MMKPRALLSALTLLVAVVSATGSASPTARADRLVYSNDWFPSGDKGIQFYAKHKGFFAAEGLDVTFTTAKGSSDSITRVASGSAEVGSGSIVALLEAKVQSNIPVKIAVAFYNLPPDAILTTEGSKLKSLKDLEGGPFGDCDICLFKRIWPLILKTSIWMKVRSAF